jgi:type I restriction enzyme S subunit
MEGLNMGIIKAMPISLPPLDLQGCFASIVESIEHQKTRLKSHLGELDALFSSLQSRAFNGGLVA